MNYEKKLELAKENNGLVTTSMVVREGLSRGLLKYLSDSGALEKTARGVYILPDAWEDEYMNYASRYERGIFSLDTALYLCDLTDRMPNRFHMTFPATYNLTGPKKKERRNHLQGSQRTVLQPGRCDLENAGRQ